MKSQQIKAGIEAEYKQTIKISTILLLVLVLFILLADSKRCPDVARITVLIVILRDKKKIYPKWSNTLINLGAYNELNKYR